MNRKKKLLLNTGTALAYQVITLVCGFVLPKFIIPYFGSATNGLINSITHFLTIITLCECGVGAVVQSAFYKPLAEKNDEEISKIVISSNRFFNKIVSILVLYVFILMIFYPIVVKDEFTWLYTASLILILALSYFAQYYFFLTYRLLLNSDQASYIQLGAHSIALIANTVITIALIKIGASVHIVKLGSVFAFLIQPLAVKWYVKKRYKLDTKLMLTEEPLKQKWNGFAQHIASVVQGNAATVVLTVFSTMSNISIYSVYYLVSHGIRQVILSINTGIQALLGNMFAKNETKTLKKTFDSYEIVFHILITLLFGITGILIIPFVRIYTADFSDAEYVQPLFSIVMVLGQAIYCLRIPYEIMVKAAGHYKQTQTASVIEAIINIVAAIVFVFVWGLVGVAISTVLAMGYRTIYLVLYLRKNIMYRSAGYFIKHLLVDVLCIVLMILATCWINTYPINYFQWFALAVIVALICCVVCGTVNIIFYRREIKNIFSACFSRLLGKKL